MKFAARIAMCLIVMFGLSACLRLHSTNKHDAAGAGHPSMDGQQVANRLNARYEQSLVVCQGEKPAYYCSGVLYRAVYWSPDFYFWNASYIDDRYDGVSFSYLHKAMGARSTYRPQGFVVSPGDDWKPWGNGKDDHFEMFCSFPFDGMTGPARGQHGCDEHIDREGSAPCLSQGIDTVDKYEAHYLKQPGAMQRWYHNCSFPVDWRWFMHSMNARKNGYVEPEPLFRYPEQVLRNWPHDRPDAVPIEALYYDIDNSDCLKALEVARALRKDFFDVTGRMLPILRWHANPLAPPFSYDDDDQAEPSDPRVLRPKGRVPTGNGPASYGNNRDLGQ